jgi:hypothetical protein
MGFNCNAIRACEQVRTFEAAKSFFEKTKQPRGKYWDADERPLYNNRSHHYRLVRGPDGEYFEPTLYRTAMARFYAPNEHGQRVVRYAGYASTASNDFRYHVLNLRHGGGWAAEFRTVLGQTVVVPIGGGYKVSHDGCAWAAKLTFDRDGLLIVSESDHHQMYRKVSADKDRARRKEIAERLQDVVMLATMRLPHFKEHARIVNDLGRPFSRECGRVNSRSEHALKAIVRDSAAATPYDYERFFVFAQHVFDVLVSKRDWDAQGNWRNGYVRTGSTENELIAAVTEQEFAKKLTERVISVIGADDRSGRELLPKFMLASDFPNSNRFFI